MICGRALIHGNSARGNNSLAVAAMERGDYGSASVYLLKAIVADPNFWPAFYNLGNCRYKLSRLDPAIWAYEQAVRQCDDFIPLYHNLGTVYTRLGEHGKALPYLQHARRLCQEENDVVIPGFVYMIPAGEDDYSAGAIARTQADMRRRTARQKNISCKGGYPLL